MGQVRHIEFTPGKAFNAYAMLADVDVKHSSGSTKTLFTVPAGKLCVIDEVFAITEEAWNGTGADLDIGVAADHDGFIDGSAVSITGAGAYAVGNSAQRGVLLYNSTDKRALQYPMTAGQAVVAYITPGTGHTAGSTRVVVWGRIVSA